VVIGLAFRHQTTRILAYNLRKHDEIRGKMKTKEVKFILHCCKFSVFWLMFCWVLSNLTKLWHCRHAVDADSSCKWQLQQQLPASCAVQNCPRSVTFLSMHSKTMSDSVRGQYSTWRPCPSSPVYSIHTQCPVVLCRPRYRKSRRTPYFLDRRRKRLACYHLTYTHSYTHVRNVLFCVDTRQCSSSVSVVS